MEPHELQLEGTEGPSRTPHVWPPLEELAELLEVVVVVAVDPELLDAVVVDPELLELVEVELELVVEDPHGFVTGMQTLTGLPSTLETGVHAVACGQDWP